MQQCFLRRIIHILFFCSTFAAQAQQEDYSVLEMLDSNFTRFTASRQQPDLFLHIDKTVYVRNENIWFTAYILSQGPLAPQHTLYTLLIEEASKKILASERFILEAGLGGGALFLPDSLPAGEYRLLAYTNSYLNHPQQSVFQQSISIRAGESTTFKLSPLPSTASTLTGDSVHFGYKVLTGYGGLASGGEVSYTLQTGGTVLQTGRKKINPFGEVNFSVPRAQAFDKRVQLEATITREKEKQVIRSMVLLFQDVAIIKLYPEGGNLVHGHASKTAIEIKNGQRVPIATKGQLLADGKPLASFQTDLYGIGVVDWVPQEGRVYTLQIADSTKQLVYRFPPVAASGYSLHLREAVVKDTTFQVEIGTPGQSSFHLIVHNYRNVFFAGILRSHDKLASLRLSTAEMPEGVVTLTLFDDKGFPRAERAVYIEKSPPVQVQLITDSAVYHHRSKLELKVKVTNSKGEPVKSLFSLACVLASRLDSTRAADIVRFAHYDRFLPSPAAMPGNAYYGTSDNIEQVLLTRYWTRYKWEEINAVPRYVASEEKVCDVGHVFFRDKPAKKPVLLMIISGGRTFTLNTDSSGYFELPSQVLQVESGKKAIILVSDNKNFKEYTVKLQNTCGMVDTGLSKVAWPEAGYVTAELSVQEQEHLRKALQAVVVVAKKREDFYDVYKSSSCNDWVCMYNILNCTNHPTGSQPVSGQMYSYRGRMVRYEGCQGAESPGFMQQVNGTSWPKEFYVADYEKFNPTAPEVMSTVFWTYKVMTDEKGEATLRFSTNDLNGRFICVLQGYSDEGVISGRTFFRVTE
jgi:hypothetical protein